MSRNFLKRLSRLKPTHCLTRDLHEVKDMKISMITHLGFPSQTDQILEPDVEGQI